jgi:hypothetical protein
LTGLVISGFLLERGYVAGAGSRVVAAGWGFILHRFRSGIQSRFVGTDLNSGSFSHGIVDGDYQGGSIPLAAGIPKITKACLGAGGLVASGLDNVIRDADVFQSFQVVLCQ